MTREAKEKQRRILVVDDEQDVVDPLKCILEQNEYEVTAVCDPIEAANVFSEGEFDAAIVDLSMPVPEGYDVKGVEMGRTTGIEMASRMHALKPNVPFLALTVVPEELVSERLAAAGIRKLLNKPAEPSAVVTTLRNLLEQR